MMEIFFYREEGEMWAGMVDTRCLSHSTVEYKRKEKLKN